MGERKRAGGRDIAGKRVGERERERESERATEGGRERV